MLVKIIRLI